ncbi:MAG: A/G-specific adenine glycosylase [Verrucomicrobia bacterium]|nr:MAG: A/G-specific adenine glycosylase [Verrucomicrobiota bacterium]
MVFKNIERYPLEIFSTTTHFENSDSPSVALYSSRFLMVDRNYIIQKKLNAWFRNHGRHDLPWRTTFSPYEVLVSEFMLQQTTVATITPRFLIWMELFPTLEMLAQASEEAVLGAWQGLGYYSRARRLHLVAKTVVSNFQGKIPRDLDQLLALPGIGPYTAKALLAFAFDQPVEVLDTNIIRVIARLNNITEPIDTKRGHLLIKESARNILPPKNGRVFASALMDLGSMVCKSGEPLCDACPLSSECEAEEPSCLPLKQPRVAITKKKEQRAFYYRRNKIYLEKSQGPLWKGLWILPHCSSVQKPREIFSSITYPITRYRVTMELYRPSGSIPKSLHPFSILELKNIAIPSPHRKALETCFAK